MIALTLSTMCFADRESASLTQYQSRRTSKIHLANFLCTKYDPSDSSSALGKLQAPVLPDLPHALAPLASSSSSKPLYYLPYKLLPWQADKIDGQVEDMRLELDKEEASWNEELVQRDAELSEMKEKLDTMNAEAVKEGGGEVKRTRLRHEDEEMTEESLPARAPPPPKEEREKSKEETHDRSSSSPMRQDGGEETVTAGIAEGEDVVECEQFCRALPCQVKLTVDIQTESEIVRIA